MARLTVIPAQQGTSQSSMGSENRYLSTVRLRRLSAPGQRSDDQCFRLGVPKQCPPNQRQRGGPEVCAPLQVCKTPDQYRYAVAAMTACQLDELHAMSWGGRQIRLGIDQAENHSSKIASSPQPCQAYPTINSVPG
jgi:hypothetical protein